MKNNDIFVKLNVKSMGEVRSLIIDKDNLKEKDGNKYIMCAGKYDRNGWTIVFKARNYKEAEYIIENTTLKAKKGCNVELFAKPHPIYC